MTPRENVQWVIENFEGFRYTDDPVDTGGATKFGITQRTLSYWRQRYTGQGPASKADVMALTLENAVQIGFDVFMTESRFIALSAAPLTQLMVYDYGFHSGFPRATEDLQRGVNALVIPTIGVDGVLGPKTRDAVLTIAGTREAGDLRLALHVLTRRENFMQDLMEKKSTQRKYMFGWWRRTTRLQHVLLGYENP